MPSKTNTGSKRQPRRKKTLPLVVGAKVRIKDGVHSDFGIVEHINGAYIYVRVGHVRSPQVLELYPNELSVEAVYQHNAFLPGKVVRFTDLDAIEWNRQKRTTHGIVRGVSEDHIVVHPIGARPGQNLFVFDRHLALEKTPDAIDENDVDELMTQFAIRALVVTCGSLSAKQLTGLLATQGRAEDGVLVTLYGLANEGKVSYDGTTDTVTAVDADDIVDQSVRDTLFASTEAVRKAKKALADAVFNTIADVGGKLPR